MRWAQEDMALGDVEDDGMINSASSIFSVKDAGWQEAGDEYIPLKKGPMRSSRMDYGGVRLW